jgi:hypothetical protein
MINLKQLLKRKRTINNTKVLVEKRCNKRTSYAETIEENPYRDTNTEILPKD